MTTFEVTDINGRRVTVVSHAVAGIYSRGNGCDISLLNGERIQLPEAYDALIARLEDR